jgi:hypothetical protein
MEISNDHFLTLFYQTKYALWNEHGREISDPNHWLVSFLNVDLDARMTNPHLRVVLKRIYKLYKEEMGYSRALDGRERRWLSMKTKGQLRRLIT